jgi:hypothetical protein
MIDKLEALVEKKFGAGRISFTKFCQRIAGPETKILFFVTCDGKPLCVLKMMRSAVYNETLKREKIAQEHIQPVGKCRVPKVYFDGFVGDRYVYAEEVISGLSISKRTVARHEREIVEFTDSFPKEGNITAQELVAMFEERLPQADEGAKKLISNLRKSGVILKKGLTHGDLGTPNILKDNRRLYIIDWAHAGKCPVALIDAVYFMSRLRRIRDLSDWRTRAAPDFMRYTGLNSSEAEALYCVHILYKILNKAR